MKESATVMGLKTAYVFCERSEPNMSFPCYTFPFGAYESFTAVLGCLTDLLPNWQRCFDGLRPRLGLCFDGKFWDSILSEKVNISDFVNF